MRTHPHAEATYRVVKLTGGAFGVEVLVPDTKPTTVSSFATEDAAEAWIARTKLRVEAESQAGRWFTRRSDRAR
jgi:hypothetical protein